MADERNDGGPAQLPLVSGGFAIVSQEDFARLSQHRWRLGANGYVYRVGARLKGAACLLHRIASEAAAGTEIHHINGDKLDCRRANLETTTPSEHQRHHKHLVIARNKAARLYPLTGTCTVCGLTYTKDRNHRGRQTVCSKVCAINAMILARRECTNVHA